MSRGGPTSRIDLPSDHCRHNDQASRCIPVASTPGMRVMPLDHRTRDCDDFQHVEPVVWVRNIEAAISLA
jgi:hypothetical protein